MKKFLSFITLILVSIFLVACEPKKKEVELTKQEVATMASAVEVSVDGSDVVSLESGIDLKVVLKGAEGSTVGDIELTAKGEIGLYADLEEFSSSYIYGKIDANYEIKGNLEDFILALMGMGEGMAEERAEEMTEDEKAAVLAMLGINLDFPKKGSVAGNVYVIAGVAYVDLTIITDGTEVKMKRYEEVFTEAEFNNFKAELTSEKLEVSELDVEELLEVANLKTYKVGDANLFEISLRKEDLDKAIENALAEFGDKEMADDVTLTHEGDFAANFSIKFQEALEQVKADAKADLEIALTIAMSEDMNIAREISIDAKFNFDLNFKGKMLKGLPKAADLKDYEHGLDFDLFGAAQ